MVLKRILIANRAEIALRILQTCQEKEIEVYTLYAKGEEELPHVIEAMHSLYLGDGSLSETYLNGDKIISLAKESGCDAIHPGYGLLSENSQFARNTIAAGLTFIGPDPDLIALMGDKSAAKKKIESLNIPIIQGYYGEDQNPDLLLDHCRRIGFPIMIKASSGGGGKGIRAVFHEDQFFSNLRSVQRESQKAFGSEHVLIEKMIQRPRHIEVQIVSDGQGGHFHLFERECSIQRRHQKIIEESPAFTLGHGLKKKICETARSIAKAIDYVGVGTIEYIIDQDENFFFLEMNTRLQVEHAVTEMVTGCNLIGLQIDIANSLPLSLRQENIYQKGYALEVRIYAEDVENNFSPSCGKILRRGEIMGSNIRFDSSYSDDNEVMIDYDSMLGKLIAWGEDRETAIARLLMALKKLSYFGIKTNREFLINILKSSSFKKGKLNTSFIEENSQDLLNQEVSSDDMACLKTVFQYLKKDLHKERPKISQGGAWEERSGFRLS